MRHGRRWATGMVGGLLVMGATAPAAGAATSLGPGCDAARPAIVHRAGGPAIRSKAGTTPVPCRRSTGYGHTDNAVVVVTKAGDVLFGPADDSPPSGSGLSSAKPGIARSTDDGRTWSKPVRAPGAPPTGRKQGGIHPYLYRDPITDRVFFNSFAPVGPGDEACPAGGGTVVSRSGDGGKTFASAIAGCASQDYGTVFSGPPARTASRGALERAGYPTVTYFCAEGPEFVIGPNRFCYRSLDGGKTWKRTASNPFVGDKNGLNYPHNGAVTPDGTVAIAYHLEGDLRVAVSRDEGDTWVTRTVPGSGIGVSLDTFLSLGLAADRAGNLYVTWVAHRHTRPPPPASRDAGKTWTTPRDVGAPGLRFARYVTVTADTPGHAAFAYFGSTQAEGDGIGDGYVKSDGRPYNGYITVTRDLFAARPTFATATVSPAGRPLLAKGISFAIAEFIGPPAFAPDGSIWAGFLGDANDGEGIAGRLVCGRTARSWCGRLR